MRPDHCSCSWPWLPLEQRCASCRAAGWDPLNDPAARVTPSSAVTETAKVSVTPLEQRHGKPGRPPKDDALTPAERARRYRLRKKGIVLPPGFR